MSVLCSFVRPERCYTQVNLVIGCTIGYAILYRYVCYFSLLISVFSIVVNFCSDVARFGLQRGSILPSSDRHDSVLALSPLESQVRSCIVSILHH
jgi:hypothetical protein